MSWMNIFGSSSSRSAKSNIPATTALQQQRLKQIDTLKTCHQNVTEIQRDVEYRVTFFVGNSAVSLNVTLPPQFPNDIPLVKVTTPLKHPWVNDQMVIVGCPALNTFYMHSSLGKAIQDVVREFCEVNPPQFINQQTPGVSGAMSPPDLGYQSTTTSSYPGYQPPGTHYSSHMFGSTQPGLSGSITSTVNTPQIDSVCTSAPALTSTEFPELNGLGLKELKDLNDDTELIEEFIKSNIESYKQIQDKKTQLINENEKIARYNLSLQPNFEAHKDTILQYHVVLSEKTQEFAKQSQKQKELSQPFSLNNIHTNMELAASQAEEESEEIADRFLLGGMKADEFIQRFMEKRKLCHLRRAKGEKLRNVHTHF